MTNNPECCFIVIKWGIDGCVKEHPNSCSWRRCKRGLHNNMQANKMLTRMDIFYPHFWRTNINLTKLISWRCFRIQNIFIQIIFYLHLQISYDLSIEYLIVLKAVWSWPQWIFLIRLSSLLRMLSMIFFENNFLWFYSKFIDLLDLMDLLIHNWPHGWVRISFVEEKMTKDVFPAVFSGSKILVQSSDCNFSRKIHPSLSWATPPTPPFIGYPSVLRLLPC